MQKQVKQKIFKYVQSGTLMKLKHYLDTCSKKIDGFHLNFTTGDLKRTPLHVACILGDDAVVRCLLHFGANGGISDKVGDTPLHLAAKYVTEVGNYSDRNLLIDPLFKMFPDTMKTVNKWGESPRQLLREAKKKQQVFSKASNEEVALCGEEQEQGPSEKSWEEKLASEWLDDCTDMGFAADFETDWAESVPEYSSFDEWADRMAEEYKRKHLTASEKHKRRKETNRKRKHEETNDMKDRLEKEQELYRKRMTLKKHEVLVSKHKRYQENLGKHKSDTEQKQKLRFKDIPWPCHGSVSEMIEVIMSGLPHNCSPKERRKFVLRQQVLWHPDKFMQRCHNRLHEDHKESILEAVNALSQALNEALSNARETNC